MTYPDALFVCRLLITPNVPLVHFSLHNPMCSGKSVESSIELPKHKQVLCLHEAGGLELLKCRLLLKASLSPPACPELPYRELTLSLNPQAGAVTGQHPLFTLASNLPKREGVGTLIAKGGDWGQQGEVVARTGVTR